MMVMTKSERERSKVMVVNGGVKVRRMKVMGRSSSPSLFWEVANDGEVRWWKMMTVEGGWLLVSNRRRWLCHRREGGFERKEEGGLKV